MSHYVFKNCNCHKTLKPDIWRILESCSVFAKSAKIKMHICSKFHTASNYIQKMQKKRMDSDNKPFLVLL